MKTFKRSTDQIRIEAIVKMICKDPATLNLENNIDSFEDILSGLQSVYRSLKGIEINRIENDNGKYNLLIKTPTKHTFFFSGDTENEAFEEAFEFLINSEKTVVALSNCIKDATSRHRIELSAQYLNYLTDMVKVSNYEQVVKRGL